ncbi:hypothetical protein D3C78_529230 [compost metagenome]
MLVHASFFAAGRGCAVALHGSFFAAFGQGFLQRGLGLLEGHAGAAAVDALTGKPRSGHLDIGGQQHHIGFGNGRCRQGVTRAHRALGLDAELVAQLLRRLLQGFGGHEGMGDASRAGGDRDDFGAALDRGCNLLGFGLIDHSLVGRFTQKILHLRQGLRRGALVQALAGETAQVQWAGVDHQHPVGGGNRGFG